MRSVAFAFTLMCSGSFAAHTAVAQSPRGNVAEASLPAQPAGASALADSRTASIPIAAAYHVARQGPSALRDGPDGRVLAEIGPAARVELTARDRGWVRVRVEGWVREDDVAPADSAEHGTLSAADLRAEPQANRGRTVHWTVQVLAFQTADPLRRDLAPDEPYLLARGPGSEHALLYLAIPPHLLGAARAIPSLANALVTARVRTGRSAPSGVPVLELLNIARR
jgi:hypothetical protein